MISINDPDALERMARVEGEQWLAYQRVPRPDDFTSFQAFKTAWEQVPESVKARVPHRYLSVNGNDAIYGDHGYARYIVRYSGELVFLQDLSPTRSHAAKAKTEGFTLR